MKQLIKKLLNEGLKSRMIDEYFIKEGPDFNCDCCKYFDIEFNYFYIRTEIYQLIINEVASQRWQIFRKTIRPDRLI